MVELIIIIIVIIFRGGVQLLDVRSWLPGQGWNPGHSDESAESSPLDPQGTPLNSLFLKNALIYNPDLLFYNRIFLYKHTAIIFIIYSYTIFHLIYPFNPILFANVLV